MLHALTKTGIGGKIGMGFGLVILMAALLGYVAWTGVGRIHSYMSEYVLWVNINSIISEEVSQNALKISSAIETYSSAPHEENKTVLQQAINSTRKGLESWEAIIGSVPQLKEALATLKEDLSRVDAALAAYQNSMASNKMSNYMAMETELKNSIGPLTAALDKTVNKLIKPAKEERVRAAASVQKEVEYLAILLSAAVVVIGILLSLLIIRAVTKPLSRAIKEIFEGADQVSGAASQVADASQQMADGSSRQAASIEESSSSLEEMSAMTKRNAEHASQADLLMKDANHASVQASRSMGDLTRSMDAISKASQETSKIVKTIDEIAFQTNLLALNAAVEAARAGEAGAGFAVVAGEVRNLAIRAADAARSTTEMIEGTVKNVNEGAKLVSETNQAFTSVSGGVEKAGQLVAEIAAASQEQAQGIEQINKAVGEMDAVVQQIAASSEESASAARQMNSQADRMKGMVSGLVALVGGERRKGPKQAAASLFVTTPGKSGPRAGKTPERKAVSVPADELALPEEIIPLENGEFKDF